jgi:hypothetical protein
MKLKKVFGTVDKEGQYPYVDIFDDETEARAEIGKPREDGLEIVDVVEGFCIVGDDGKCVDESRDFYFTEEEAKEHMEEIANETL